MAFKTRSSFENQPSYKHAIRIPQAICNISRQSRSPHKPSNFCRHMWLGAM